jgi:hypothetical protein
VEIGVLNGDYSEYFLNEWKSCSAWYAVDPWAYQKTYDDPANVEQKAQDERYANTIRRLSRFAHAHVVRNYSSEAAKAFKDGTIDFVYIDARHDFRSVLEDLRTWWPKLRVGGVIAGHDFMNVDEISSWKMQPDGSIDPYGRAVRAAAEEFSRSVERQLVVCYRENSFNTYYFAK